MIPTKQKVSKGLMELGTKAREKKYKNIINKELMGLGTNNRAVIS